MESNAKILLVEDNENFIPALSEHFKETGRLIVCEDSESAWKAFNIHNFDLICVILGGRLVRGTTLPLARKIHAIGFKKPVISFSGDADLQELQMEAGCTKEFAKMEIVEMVKFVKKLT